GSTRTTARSRRGPVARSAASPKAASGPWTSPSGIRTSSPSSRAGPATCSRPRSARSTARTSSGSRRTTRCGSSSQTRRSSGGSGRTSGSTRARRTGCAHRTPPSPRGSARSTSRTGSERSTAATTGRSGARTPSPPTLRPPPGWPMARRLLRSRALRIATSATLAPAVVVAATGWLYLLRPVGRLGPGVHDALALDELSRRATSPLVLYVVVWAAAAVLVGLLARFAGADGLTAGLVLGPAVGGWLYLLNGVSILVVRQVPAHEAFRAASTEQAVLLPALLVAFAGALLGRQRGSGRDRSRATLAWLVAGVALLAAWDATFPAHRRSLVAAFDPAQVHGATKAAVAPLAAVLLLAARSLARGSRRAWQVALVVLVALLVLHIGRRFSEGAIVTGVVAVALVARRADFRRRGDPTARPRV